VQHYKDAVFRNTALPSKHRIALLQRNLPRYLWVARASVNQKPSFDLLFDATDLLQGTAFLPGVPYDLAIGKAIGAVLSHPKFVAILGQHIRAEKRMADIAKWLNSL
jgi:hypothetical protein